MSHDKLTLPALRLAAVSSLMLLSAQAWACSSEAYTGSVCMTAANYCPSDYVEADGRLLSINNYQALYSLLGTVYGGDARTTFGVPDLRGRLPVGLGQGPGLTNVLPGTKDGAEKVILLSSQMPAHTHVATFVPTTGTVPVSIPGKAASGAITATATTDIVPGSTAVDPAANVPNYYLTGVTSGASGPVTTTTPGTDKSTLLGTKVAIDSSQYQAATATQSVNVSGVVTGGAVTNGVTGGSQPFSIIPPRAALRFCIATQGLYPPRP